MAKDKNRNDVSLIIYGTMLQNYKLSLPKDLKDIWIADSGASSYITNGISELRNQEHLNARIKIIIGYVNFTIKKDMYGMVISEG